jgi:hypothetical protein
VTAPEGSFDAIQLRVKRSAVRFVNVTVVYGAGTRTTSGPRRDPGRREVAGARLRGANRVIKRIDFAYEARRSALQRDRRNRR